MIGTSALAERLYVAWRERMEFIAPLPLDPFVVPFASPYWSAENPMRPKWAALTSQEQDVWKHVAQAAGAVLADAMGAL